MPLHAQVPVSRWGKLDSSAPWEEYAAGAGAAPVVEAIKAFQPEVVMVVDWSALVRALRVKSSLWSLHCALRMADPRCPGLLHSRPAHSPAWIPTAAAACMACHQSAAGRGGRAHGIPELPGVHTHGAGCRP